MKNIYIDVGEFVSVRAMHIYDVYKYFRNISDTGRIGVGIIKKGQDYLVPPCDYERDICCYVSGGYTSYSRNYNCPHIEFAANGQIMSHYGLAILYKSDDYIHPRGHYISTTAGCTDKFRGRDYDTYDQYLHRDAGIAGIGIYDDTGPDETPHGSSFFFDISNAVAPTYTALVAANNVAIKGLGLRHLSYKPDYTDRVSVNNYVAHFLNKSFNFYTRRYYPGDVLTTYEMLSRRLNKTVTINGETMDLYAVTLDYPYSGSADGVQWKYFESPYLVVHRPNTSKTGTLYILDECVTIHKPVLD